MSAMIMNGKAPTLISGVPKRGVLGGDDQIAGERDAERTGEHVTAGRADAWACPAEPISLKRPTKRSEPKCLCTSGTSPAKPPRLAPEEKVFSCEEASTTQRTSSSSRARSKRLGQPASSSAESALRVSGSLSVIVRDAASATA